ncbi:hypothetical protein CDAR_365041 [Caerostris darwini]|uniref:Uncharacterized protein n=1 Tax=Caerostris darwini TaxID=1538125 RepID=A0AAV4S468_9ARAC|nr:hypothetical protein CDAR_365041 [Caerostris darwini]
MDSSIHIAVRSKDILEIPTHLSFAKFREGLSEMRRDVPHPHPSALIGKYDRLDGIRILSGPLTSMDSDSCPELDIQLVLVENYCVAEGKCHSSVDGRFLSFGACLSTTPADCFVN